ncbi:HPr kinase/phosphorylase [Thalassococcus sp. S3]|uniref:HPr kinase/phosphorylase n=1 Tax=Thalassococcus sp. S3 TaxID=2017482 RepID=UPI001024605F|nr:HPr kinase/phosphatase C-terminal domain-containing protein [Thalassococcus sp. S3]QBF30037.1 serine kinase [Thalassococcus sp. S3]
MARAQDHSKVLHATCVAYAGRGLLITGASGQGKSSLALHLMALGAELVSDDRVILTRRDNRIVADAPDTIRGLIEARGFGLLNAKPFGPSDLHAVVTLDKTEAKRLPDPAEITLLGVTFPLFQKSETTHFPAALVQYLKAGLWVGS